MVPLPKITLWYEWIYGLRAHFCSTKQKQNNMKKVVLVFGFISGIISSVLMAIGMLVYSSKEGCSDYGMVIGFASMLLAFSLIFVAIKTFRDKHNNGIVSFGKAFLIGLYISLITSTMYVCSWAVLYNTTMPDFMDKYVASAIEKAKSSGKSEKTIAYEIAKLENAQKNYHNPIYFAAYTYMEILPVGILVSLICAGILKRKSKKEDPVAG